VAHCISFSSRYQRRTSLFVATDDWSASELTGTEIDGLRKGLR